MERSTNSVTLSAFVHSATFPGAVKVESACESSCLPSNDTVKRLPSRTQRQDMPFPGAHLDVRSGELLAPSLHDAVEADVILERIRRVR